MLFKGLLNSYVKTKLCTRGHEHCFSCRIFFQVPWHWELPTASQCKILPPSALWPSPEQRCVSVFIAGGWQATQTVCPSRRYCIHRAYGRFSKAQSWERDSVLNSTQYLLVRERIKLSTAGNAQSRWKFKTYLDVIQVELKKCKFDDLQLKCLFLTLT